MLTTASTSMNASSLVAPWISGDNIDHVNLGHTVSCMVERTLSEHEHLFFEGKRQTHVYQVVEGVIGIYKMLADGRRQICNFAYPGDIVGLDTIGKYNYSGEALNDTVVRCIPLNAIEKLMRSEPGFGQALLLYTANELADTREQLVSLGRKTATEKLATFLLRISRRSSGLENHAQVISIPMRRCEIADFLGLTIETVSRTFTRLKSCGVIKLLPNTQVAIVDGKKLECIANGQSMV